MKDRIYGKILQGIGGLYTVRILSVPEDNDSSLIGATIDCRARGSFRHNNITPLAGDNVILLPATVNTNEKYEKNSESSDFVIDDIVDRKNALIRPPMANLDFLFITMSASAPTPILSTIDKLISIAEFNNIEPVIVITKCELDPIYAAELEQIYKKSGFEVFKLSAVKDIDIAPIDRFIRENLSGKTAAFAGASGIGKSTLLNRLFPSLSLSTSEISQKIQRGRHTTRKVELYALDKSVDCGYIADTPGFSMLDFARFDFFEVSDLPLTMREFKQHIGSCKYTKCSHTKEEGCAIIDEVKNGNIPVSRHQSFCELYEVLKAKKKW